MKAENEIYLALANLFEHVHLKDENIQLRDAHINARNTLNKYKHLSKKPRLDVAIIALDPNDFLDFIYFLTNKRFRFKRIVEDETKDAFIYYHWISEITHTRSYSFNNYFVTDKITEWAKTSLDHSKLYYNLCRHIEMNIKRS